MASTPLGNILSSSSYQHDKSYRQRVLLIDGFLLDEPSLEVQLEDLVGHTTWLSTFVGPTDGWHVGEAWQDFERACRRRGEVGYAEVPEERRKLDICTLSRLHEVVDALPAALAAWQIARTESLDADIAKSEGATAMLRDHLADHALQRTSTGGRLFSVLPTYPIKCRTPFAALPTSRLPHPEPGTISRLLWREACRVQCC